uniref:SUEL-type lectin domain-containing protein n=1 Tax=Rodentolepis nana TaxID=102285 RepID=A0A0R3TSC4_RODNA
LSLTFVLLLFFVLFGEKNAGERQIENNSTISQTTVLFHRSCRGQNSETSGKTWRQTPSATKRVSIRGRECNDISKGQEVEVVSCVDGRRNSCVELQEAQCMPLQIVPKITRCIYPIKRKN